MRIARWCSAAALVGVLWICVFSAAPALGQTLLERLEQRVRDRLGQTAPASAAPLPAVPGREEAEALPPPPTAEPERRAPVLGIEAEQTAGDRPALVVVRVSPGSPAEAAGVRVGDELVAVGERRVAGFADLNAAMSALAAGERVTLDVRRGGLPMQTTALLAAAPPAPEPDEGEPSVEAQGPVPEAGARSSGTLGISVDDASLAPAGAPVRRGALVIGVTPGSPAERVGIKPGDVIVALDGKLVSDVRGLKTELQRTRPGQQVELTYYQGAEMNRASMALAGPGGVAAVAGEASFEAGRASTDAPSGGVGAILGGIGKIWGGGADARAAGAAPARPAEPAAQARAEAELQAEVGRLRERVEQLEARLAELEQQEAGAP